MTNEEKKDFVPIKIISLYLVLLYSLWFAYHFFITNFLNLFPASVSALIGDGLIKNLVWTLPAVLLIKKYKDNIQIDLKEMLTWKKECNRYLLLFPAFAAYLIVIEMLANGGKLVINDTFGIDKIIIFLFVGVTEEFAFRGWLLNATIPRNENAAIAVNAVLFLAIHFPRWISEGIFITNFANRGFVSIIALSVIFSIIFIRSKNIILPITLHMLWDLLIFMLG